MTIFGTPNLCFGIALVEYKVLGQIRQTLEINYTYSLDSPAYSTAIFVRSGVLGKEFWFGHFQRDCCYGMTCPMHQYEGKIAKNQLFFRDNVPENRVSSKNLIFGDFSPRVQNPLKF